MNTQAERNEKRKQSLLIGAAAWRTGGVTRKHQPQIHFPAKTLVPSRRGTEWGKDKRETEEWFGKA